MQNYVNQIILFCLKVKEKHRQELSITLMERI